jgi:hypothetical protein
MTRYPNNLTHLEGRGKDDVDDGDSIICVRPTVRYAYKCQEKGCGKWRKVTAEVGDAVGGVFTCQVANKECLFKCDCCTKGRCICKGSY